jgi:hypothetical protein
MRGSSDECNGEDVLCLAGMWEGESFFAAPANGGGGKILQSGSGGGGAGTARGLTSQILLQICQASLGLFG